MSLTTPAGLEQSLENLRSTLADLVGRADKTNDRLARLEAVLSSHTHDYTRDITGKPSSYTPATHSHSEYVTSSTYGSHTHSYQDTSSVPSNFTADHTHSNITYFNSTGTPQ